jgi:hypothetical protein
MIKIYLFVYFSSLFYNLALMKKLSEAKKHALRVQAKMIVADIAKMMGEFPDDAPQSKFFLTDAVAQSLLVMGATFASLSYTPSLEEREDVASLPACNMFYLATTYGAQIYLKEHSILTNSAPYSFMTDRKKLESVRKKIFELAATGDMKSTPLADVTIEIFLQHFMTNFQEVEFDLEHHKLNKETFFKYMGTSLYWGYNFARNVIIEK